MEPKPGARRTSRAAASHLSILTGVALCVLASPVCGQEDSWTSLREMPTKRRLLAAAADGGKIYTFGGCGSPCFAPPLHTSTREERRVEVYDPKFDRPGSNPWSVHKPIPAIIFGAAAAPGNGKIYLFGGFVTGNSVLEYNPDDDSWAAKKPMPTPRHGLAAVALGDRIYVMGGSNGSAASNALEIYHPANDTWTPGPPMPTARVFLAAAVVDRKIFAIGGSPDCCGKSQTAAVEIYDPDHDSWTTGAPLPVALQTSAAASLNGKIYVFGGFIPGEGVKKSTFEYDPKLNSWETDRKALPTPRDQAPAVVVGEFIYVLGGSVACHCTALGDNDRYKPKETPRPKLDCSKAGPPSVSAGGLVTYTIRVNNTGGAAATGVTLNDDIPSGLAFVPSPGSLCGEGFPCSLGTIEARGARGPVNVTFRVPEACSAPSSIKNVARVKALETEEVTCKVETLVTGVAQKRDLELSITEKPVHVDRGQLVNYPVEVLHTGAAMTGVKVEVKVTGGIPQPSPSCSITPNGFMCGLSNFSAGNSSQDLALSVRAPQGCPCPPAIRIEATVTGKEPECDESNNADFAETDVGCTADLAITKEINQPNPLFVKKGKSIPYLLKVTNNGSDSACTVIARDTLQPGLGVPPDLPAGCSVTPANEIVCQIGDMTSKNVKEIGFSVPQSKPCNAKIPNTATVTASSTDPDENNNSAMAMTTVTCCELSITKTDDLATAMPGQTLNYTIVASNTDSEEVAVATVNDNFPEGLNEVRWCRDTSPIPCTPTIPGNLNNQVSLPSDTPATYRAQGIVDIKFAGTLSNTATVAAPDCAGASATDHTVIGFTGVKAFCTSITGSFMEGGVITKTFVLINGGPAFQADNPGNEFEDPLPPGLTLIGVGPPSSGISSFLGNTAMWNGSIAVGDMVTITINATIDAGTAGTTLCNQATINFDADGNGTNESMGVSDDHHTPAPGDPCCFLVQSFEGIPALSVPGLLALALLLASFALLRLSSRSP